MRPLQVMELCQMFIAVGDGSVPERERTGPATNVLAQLSKQPPALTVGACVHRLLAPPLERSLEFPNVPLVRGNGDIAAGWRQDEPQKLYRLSRLVNLRRIYRKRPGWVARKSAPHGFRHQSYGFFGTEQQGIISVVDRHAAIRYLLDHWSN